VIPVTVIEVGPCTVLKKKTVASDGYDAVQLGFADKKKQRVKKDGSGSFCKVEGRCETLCCEKCVSMKKSIGDYEVGQILDCNLLKLAITWMFREFPLVKATKV